MGSFLQAHHLSFAALMCQNIIGGKSGASTDVVVCLAQTLCPDTTTFFIFCALIIQQLQTWMMMAPQVAPKVASMDIASAHSGVFAGSTMLTAGHALLLSGQQVFKPARQQQQQKKQKRTQGHKLSSGMNGSKNGKLRRKLRRRLRRKL